MNSILDSISLDERQQRCLEELVALTSPEWARIKNRHRQRWGDILDDDEIDEVMTDALFIVVMHWDRVFHFRRFYRATVRQGMRDCVRAKCNRKKREIPQEYWQEIKDCSPFDMQERYTWEAWQEERERALYQAFTTLNGVEFQAITMYHFGNMAYSEIALCLGRTPGAVRKYNHRTRTRKLKPAIERYLASSQIH